MPQGLADSSKIEKPILENGKKLNKEFHKVQILDPAVGTGTFLAQVIRQIYTKFQNKKGISAETEAKYKKS